MGLRAAGDRRRSRCSGVKLGAGALLGDADPDVYAECVRLGRLAWCALAVGTGQAVLDYVKPYVNERVAFGEPISQPPGGRLRRRRTSRSSSRACASPRYRAASRADQGLDYAREVALARRLCRAPRACRSAPTACSCSAATATSKEHPVERWYRDLRAAGSWKALLLV